MGNSDARSNEQLRAEIAALRRQVRELETQHEVDQARFDAFMENSPVIAFIKDEEGRLLYINQRFIEMFGFHEVDWYNKTDAELWPAETAEVLRRNDVAILEDGVPVQVEEPVRRADGVHHWLSFKFPFTDASGQRYLGGTAVEITELKRMQRELERARELAESSTRAKSTFMANMSHEIRTPMNGILGASEMLSQMEMGPEAHECVEVIYRSGTDLLTLLNDILDFSKIEAGKMDIEAVPTDIEEVVRSVYELFKLEAADKRLAFTVDTSGLTRRGFLADPGRIRQIAMNLVSNAIKFTSEGSVAIACRNSPVRAESDPARATVEIEVRDTGIGIPEDSLDAIFDVFSQLDPSITRTFGGTGLGLAISRRLARLMGGEIHCESEQGRGSRFTLAVDLVPYRTPTAREPTPSPVRTYDKMVLLVEDNAVNRLVAERMLGKLGIQIDVALNGQEAVSKLRDRPYDAVLMDIHMPIMDGIEAARQIRALPERRDVPIVAMSANLLQTTTEECLRVGMNGFIPKPISQRALVDELDRWLAL